MRLRTLEDLKTLSSRDSDEGINPTPRGEEIYKEKIDLSPHAIKPSVSSRANPKRPTTTRRSEIYHDIKRTRNLPQWNENSRLAMVERFKNLLWRKEDKTAIVES